MKYSAEKKNAILMYILEKIAVEATNTPSKIADSLGISANTVHAYLKQLQASGIIERQKRGNYQLVTRQESYLFSRSQGELESDTAAYHLCLSEKIHHLSDNIKTIWEYALSEMVNNVIDHSEAETMQITVAENYLKTYVVIQDNGVGIFEKIKQHFSLPGTDEAICELFKGKLTTDETNHSGEGIFFTSKMMDSFVIFSGGKVFTTSKYNNDNILNLGGCVSGTCVFMALSNFTKRSAKEVFDLYSSVDGGFTTTRIPLKNIFDSAPVSRSQAKRISNRLEEFEEVILDFENIDWMGQGFAHQMFVVFKNAHPNVSITPVNMSESVKSMYHHVIKTV